MFRFAAFCLLVSPFAMAQESTPTTILASVFASPHAPQKGWPKDVPVPAGMKAYTPTRLSQRITVTDGAPSNRWYDINRDDVFQNAPTSFNPNRREPYRVSGGMDGLAGWKSVKMTNVDASKVTVVHKDILIAGTPSAPGKQFLPGLRWSYPDGTVFADVLTNDRDEIFELRTRTKENGKWKSVVAYEDATVAPKGYKGAGKSCLACHKDAGDSQQYGILVRGDDQCFSFLPVKK